MTILIYIMQIKLKVKALPSHKKILNVHETAYRSYEKKNQYNNEQRIYF